MILSHYFTFSKRLPLFIAEDGIVFTVKMEENNFKEKISIQPFYILSVWLPTMSFKMTYIKI